MEQCSPVVWDKVAELEEEFMTLKQFYASPVHPVIASRMWRLQFWISHFRKGGECGAVVRHNCVQS